MQVKSLKNNNRLIKGQVYEAEYYNNLLNPTGVYTRGHGRIQIKDIGYYTCKNFTLPNGDPLPTQLYDIRENSKYVGVSDIKKGDIVVCRHDDRFKYLIKGGRYRISDVDTSLGKIKLEGYTRYIAWSGWVFRPLSLQESRDLTLSQIFDKEENFSVDFKRKFEQAQNKDKLLIETIAKSILDKWRHHYDIIDWGIEKNSKIYSMDRKDFGHLLEKPLSEILSIFENF